MIMRKKALTLGVIACMIATSLTAVAYGGFWGWNPQGLANWMHNYGADFIRNTYNTVQYNIKPTLANFYEWVKDEVDRETVEIEILPIKYTTFLGFIPPTPSIYQSTSIGESDLYSGVYVMPTLKGFGYDAAYMTATVKDGGTYEWEVEVIHVETGWYYIFVEAPDGVDAGSYMVEVYVRVNSGGEDYYGTAFYVIDCTATTNGGDIIG